MKRIISAITAATIFIGCSTSNGDRTKLTPNEANATNTAEGKPYDLACGLLADFPNNLDEISRNTRAVISGNDSCVLGLMDSIKARYMATGEERYIAYLGDICNESDGYVADYLTDVMTSAFTSRADSTMHHLNKLKNKRLDKMLIIGMRRQIRYPSSAIVEKDTIDSIVANLLTSPGYPEADKRYLREINEQWEKDPNGKSQ